jgi:N-acyl homoserine lactone hydrolase
MNLFLLQLGLLQPLGVPVPGYLIQTNDGTNVLVDSGFPYSFVENPPGPPGPLNLKLQRIDY